MHKITKGLDLPIGGAPEPTVDHGPSPTAVGLVGDDYPGMKPTMAVVEGDRVKLGQVLFTDKKTDGVRYTSPGAGRVVSVARGAKRKFESVAIELDGDEAETFDAPFAKGVRDLTREETVDLLLTSGLWTAIRRRPFARVPAPTEIPHSIFVTAIDTNPLAGPVQPVLDAAKQHFAYGLRVLGALTEGTIYVCTASGAEIPGQDAPRVSVETFSGPHPAGLPGTHIHVLDAARVAKPVWYVGYQDVIALGALFETGTIDAGRTVALAGPSVKKPRLLRTRVGAGTTEMLRYEVEAGDVRLISGSVLSGRTLAPPVDYLGRYHVQISALPEGRERELLGWHMPGFDKHSVKPVFASSLPGRNGSAIRWSTSTGGSPRAMVPIGSYEKVMPLDILPTFLLRALIVGDTDRAQALGALELDEDDIALCTYVCPGKYEYGPILRDNLTKIELEG